MRVYLSGITDLSIWRKIEPSRQFYNDFLFSYYYCIRENGKWFEKGDFSGKNIFLDSGAFSAKNKGIDISIVNYGNFILLHKDSLEYYSNLDVIGDSKQTAKNQERLESIGLSPVPVFHWGEDILILKKLCEQYNYVSIGNTVPIKPKTKLAEQIVSALNYVNYNMTRIHLFGFSSFPGMILLKDYIYSVDSTTWRIRARFKECLNPDGTCKKCTEYTLATIANKNIRVIYDFLRSINE